MKRTLDQNLAAILAGLLAALHCAACILLHSRVSSNLIQLAAGLLAVALCAVRARKSSSGYFRWLWYCLCVAFSLWACGQVYDVGYALTHTSPLRYPNPADFFWLLYSFPILFLAARTRTHPEKDWIDLLDLVQACISAALLYSIIVFIPGIDMVDRAYDIQGVALLFACAIRYSTGGSNEERVFFRNLTIYVVSYDLLGLVTQLIPQNLVVDGAASDLAYSFPFLIFVSVSTLLPDKLPPALQWKLPKIILPAHVHGISCLGLALTSIASGVVLTIHHAPFGAVGVILSCSVFALRTAIRESQLQRAQFQLEYDNHHDGLTGLANRTLLLHELEQPNKSPLENRSLLFLDLDRFKMINDSLGHTIGDQLLVHVANMLRLVVRPEDIVSRLGGDEFVVLLNDCPDTITAETIAERILTRLRSPVLLDGRVIHAAGSIGIAALEKGKSSTHVLRHADAAMYAAKSLGRNRVRVFDRSVLDRAARQLEMETDLRRSVAENSIAVAYQPIYSLQTGTLRGFEALARWTHPRYGAISPDDFIPLAEDAGLIVDLGEQVLRKACRQGEIWNREFHSRLTMGVNVSGRQLTGTDFLQCLDEILRDSKLHPSLLRFEVTESVLLSDREPAFEILNAARDMGVRIYLDDFGKGYSALNYLLEFPFDGIKIDKSFIDHVERDDRRKTVLATIIQLAKALDKSVVAEGVETEAQRQFVTRIECDYVQGFLFSEPLTADEVTGMLHSELAVADGPFPSLSKLTPGIAGTGWSF